MKCEVCKIKESNTTKPYTVTIKEDVYSKTIKGILKKGTKITVDLPICQECLDLESRYIIDLSFLGDKKLPPINPKDMLKKEE